ncbi:MAG: hypothetical protein IJ057_03880 [Bacteroidales bacterium]|nr:hypothetical protein [Bacteroidales bacterium]
MAKIIRAVDWYVHLAMIVSIGLGIAAFCTPPYAVIDRSILAFIAEITGSAALFTFLVKLPEYIEKGATAKFQRGNTSIEVGGKKKRGRDIEPEETIQDDFETEEEQ